MILKKAGVYVLLGFLLFLCTCDIIGCAYASRNLGYYQSCKDDPECMEQAGIIGNLTTASVHKILDSVPIASNLAEVISLVAGLLGAAVGGVVLGRRYVKRKGGSDV